MILTKEEYVKNLNKTVKEIKKLPLHKIDEDVKLLKRIYLVLMTKTIR